jgi:hypothetical protein
MSHYISCQRVYILHYLPITHQNGSWIDWSTCWVIKVRDPHVPSITSLKY